MIQTDTNEHRMTRVQSIPVKQRQAVVYRAEGIKFQDIAEHLETSVFTVKNWFRPGTDTAWAYKEYKRARASEITTEALHRSRMLSEKAMEVLEGAMEDDMSPSVRLRVAIYILDKNIPQAIAEEEAMYLYELDRKGGLF